MAAANLYSQLRGVEKNAKVERKEADESPVFFTYAGEPGITTYQTFRVDNTGAPVKAFVATEEIAATREIMIIGLSEKLRPSIDKSVNVEPKDMSVKGRQVRTNGTAVEAKIGMMSLKTNREDWAGGASEVACVGAVVWRAPGGLNPYNPPNNTPDVSLVGPNGQLGGYDGSGGNTPVADWTRKEVSNQQWKTVDFALVSYWNPYWYPTPGYHGPVDSKGDTAPYIIYEADAWPSAMRSKEWYLSTGSTTGSVYVFVQYRSSDVPFHEEIVTTDPTKASNSSADGYYSEQTTSFPFETTSFNYQGHYPITTQIQYWFYR